MWTGLPKAREAVAPDTFTFSLRRDQLRQTRHTGGHYLLRSNLTAEDPATLARHYPQLTKIEPAFKELKHDLALSCETRANNLTRTIPSRFSRTVYRTSVRADSGGTRPGSGWTPASLAAYIYAVRWNIAYRRR